MLTKLFNWFDKSVTDYTLIHEPKDPQNHARSHDNIRAPGGGRCCCLMPLGDANIPHNSAQDRILTRDH
ncbi:hypothetical protein A359_00210 [secondary endosymbiont of Ctenarytaina eucalypti]|uniref:Uncharacterized protein n=1 Tax=secondary endosymbiont of Ctenarytaina eucalypti TaxID=1199245 RepID=J3YR19_9ENTR|nr:hypothetical protein A359_00210 [secondary endosymbiont of Ctenarytaina eucalypti]